MPNQYIYLNMRDYSSLLQELENLSAYGTDRQIFALLVVYIPQFDDINIEYGYHVGNQVLEKITDQISTLLKKQDSYAKIGNQEIAILLKDPANPGQVILAAQKIHEHLNLNLQLDNHTLKVQINIGITYYPHHSTMSSELIRQAGIAARSAARNRISYCVYSKDTVARESRISLESSLEAAIDNAEIRAYYQPIIDLKSGKTVAFESLARWKSEEFGNIPPATFVDIAEKSSLIRNFTILTLNTTLREFYSISRLFPDTKISINLSPVLLDSPDIIDVVKRALIIWDIQPELLVLEITESAIMQDEDISSSILEKFHQLGISIAIDDFGMGQASLKYIKHLPINEIKVDKSFINKINRDADDRKIVTSIIDLSHSLNLSVVAEGIESLECMELLRDMNCDYGQGFYYSRPLPVEKLSDCSQNS